MKAFINNGAVVALGCLLLGACGQTEPAALPEETLEVETVEEVVLPTPQPTPEPPARPLPPASAKPAPAVSYQSGPTQSVQEILEQLKKWEQGVTTLRVEFSQVSSYDGVEINRSQGRLYYDRPRNLLRWEMLNPAGKTEQAAITDKKQIRVLDDAQQTVATLSWQEWQKGQANHALFDIGNYAELAAKHQVSLDGQDEKKAVLSFKPTQPAGAYTLLITLSKHNFVPQEITLLADGMQTRTELSAVQKNAPLAADLFGGFLK